MICPDCHGYGIIETSPAGAGHEDDLAEYVPCPHCRIHGICPACQGVTGVCVDCGLCMVAHCACDPCQHDRRRDEECTFCQRVAFSDTDGL